MTYVPETVRTELVEVLWEVSKETLRLGSG